MSLLSNALDHYSTLKSRKITESVLTNFGCYSPDGRIICIPLHDAMGNKCGELIRTTEPEKYYVSPTGMAPPLFNLCRVGWGLTVLYVFESVFDVMAVWPNVHCVALIGLNMREQHISQIKALSARLTVVSFDGDQAGQMAAINAGRKLLEAFVPVGIARSLSSYHIVAERDRHQILARDARPGLMYIV